MVSDLSVSNFVANIDRELHLYLEKYILVFAIYVQVYV